MLYLLLCWFILGIVALAVGLGICQQLGLSLPVANPLAESNRSKATFISPFSTSLMLLVWIGLLGISVTLLSVSLILPLSPGVGLGVGIGLLGLSWRRAETRTEWRRLLAIGRVGGWGLVLAIALITAFGMTRPVVWDDTGLYHYGAIRWLADYGSVVGVALIHDRFGFVSSWFALAAPFSGSALDSRALSVTNGFVMWILGLQGWAVFSRVCQAPTQFLDWFRGVSVFALLVMTLGSTLIQQLFISPSPDVPIMMLAIVMSELFLLGAESTDPATRDGCAWLALGLGVGAVTIKLSGLPLLGMGGLYFLHHYRRHGMRLLQGVGLIGVIGLPYATFGWLASGCPLYPSTALCLDVPWRLPMQTAAIARDQIQGWTSWFPNPPPGTPIWRWMLGQWLQMSVANQLFGGLAILSVGLGGWMIYQIWRSPTPFMLGLVWASGLGLLGSVFTFVISPLLRFGLGYLLVLPGVIIAWLCFVGIEPHWVRQPLPVGRKWHLVIGSGMTGLVVVAIAHSVWAGVLWVPPPLHRVPVAYDRMNDVAYRYPAAVGQDLCWAIPNPCALGPLEVEIQLRHPERGLSGGFERVEHTP